MPLVKYRIYELSARAVISYGRQQECAYAFQLSAAETEKCKSLSAPHEQDDNALFYQTMCVLRGDAFTGTPGGQLVTDLSDIIFYMDFSGIFDRSGARKKHLIRQEKARVLFRPEGVSLDFGSGAHRYLAFERSGSMSRQARLAFIREDFYDTVCRRIMMDMTIGDCQLSKLYAYNGLMLSSGIRIDGIGIDRPHRVVVIDNPTCTERNVSVITVEDDGTQSSTRKYHRVEKKEDIEITCFDGEGLISKEYARVVDEKLCGKKVHTSFQIRMPYVKGMLHEVDFKDFLTLCGTDTITDLWGMVPKRCGLTRKRIVIPTGPIWVTITVFVNLDRQPLGFGRTLISIWTLCINVGSKTSGIRQKKSTARTDDTFGGMRNLPVVSPAAK